MSKSISFNFSSKYFLFGLFHYFVYFIMFFDVSINYVVVDLYISL